MEMDNNMTKFLYWVGPVSLFVIKLCFELHEQVNLTREGKCKQYKFLSHIVDLFPIS